MRSNKHIKDTYRKDFDTYTIDYKFEYIEEQDTNYSGLDIVQVLYNGITDITTYYCQVTNLDDIEEEIINHINDY